MSTVIVLAFTGLGLGALYFLIASGLSLIFGLMHVLNFAHGAILGVGAYVGWWAASHVGGGPGLRLLLAVLVGMATSTVLAALLELVLVRRLYDREIAQVLVTVGVGLALVALLQGIWGTDPRSYPVPGWMRETIHVGGAAIPQGRIVVIVVGALVLAAFVLFLRHTRYGLIVRAGVENRAMVTALGIDVRRAFTLVFALGGAAAGLAGALAGAYFGTVTPQLGSSLLIYAFIVVVIGGLGSVTGSAIAAVLVGLLQQFTNYYAASGLGDLSVVLLLAVVLLLRPQGLLGRPV
ncbi:ABC transporter permease subunit [Nocardioides panaciterrulae]|uniref:Branched-chain amino acid transport system permease protein n=1 Tax=Nocardioides panaciterrulae TaxID=661492 RepID=A0A7Y9JAG2_9ACTN|nr:branched-chain amino acid transport system permease protein [Nocardioides panaciterrulae]